MNNSYISLKENQFIYYKNNTQVLSNGNWLRNLETGFGIKKTDLHLIERLDVARDLNDIREVYKVG